MSEPAASPRPFAWWILTFFGSGASPVAPGTAGSLAAVAVAGGLFAAGVPAGVWFGGLAVGMALLHLAVGDRIEEVFGTHDPGAVVSDEVCGQWIAFAFPLAAVPWGWALPLGFILFRIFDITKIGGVRRLEKIPGKWGVLLDDVLAGLYAGVILWGLGTTGVFDGTL